MLPPPAPRRARRPRAPRLSPTIVTGQAAHHSGQSPTKAMGSAKRSSMLMHRPNGQHHTARRPSRQPPAPGGPPLPNPTFRQPPPLVTILRDGHTLLTKHGLPTSYHQLRAGCHSSGPEPTQRHLVPPHQRAAQPEPGCRPKPQPICSTGGDHCSRLQHHDVHGAPGLPACHPP